MFLVWKKLSSPLCEQSLCLSVTGYAWNLARTYNLKSFQPWTEKSLPKWFAFVKGGITMCPLFNILDHTKMRTRSFVLKACWEETGLSIRNRAIFFASWQTNLKQMAFWAFFNSKSSTLWKINSCKANTSLFNEIHAARAILRPLLRGQTALNPYREHWC